MKTSRSLTLLLAPLALFGAETEPDLLNTLTDDMATIAQTAKSQRANIDYLPYIMTVFEGKELSRAGASSLKEALALAAGVNLSRDNVAR